MWEFHHGYKEKHQYYCAGLGLCPCLFKRGARPVVSIQKSESTAFLPGSKQLVTETDHLGRATSARYSATGIMWWAKEREPMSQTITVGWHNYKIAYGKQREEGRSIEGNLIWLSPVDRLMKGKSGSL